MAAIASLTVKETGQNSALSGPKKLVGIFMGKTLLLMILMFEPIAFAGPSLNKIMNSTAGAQVIAPSYFWGTKTFINEVPELSVMNPSNPQIEMIVRYLEDRGIGYISGAGTHIHSFDLYLDFVVHLSTKFPTLGLTAENKLSKSYWAAHDAYHQVAGTPGPRLVDLNDRERSIDRMTAIIQTKEAIATGWTPYHYVRWLYEFRDKQKDRSPEQHAEFDRLNNGTFSHGAATAKDLMDIGLAVQFLRPFEIFRIAQNGFNEARYHEAVNAGVPMVVPNLEHYLGRKAQKFMMKWVVPFYVAFYNALIDSDVGHFAQHRYAKAYATFLYRPWLVAWAEAFQIGTPLSTMETEQNQMINNFNEEKLLREMPPLAPKTFELMYLRNYVSRLGRKLFELEYLANQELTKPLLNTEQLSTLASLKNRSILLAKQISQFRKNSRIDEINLENFATKTLDLVDSANRMLNVQMIDWKSIPNASTLAKGNDFWGDPFQFFVERPKQMTTVFGAGDLMLHPNPEAKAYESVCTDNLTKTN